MLGTTLYKEARRSQFHFSARTGWINDPNGLVYYDGEYHLFFQHNPCEPVGGNCHWGHAISTDLVHWKQVDHALYPDELGQFKRVPYLAVRQRYLKARGSMFCASISGRIKELPIDLDILTPSASRCWP